MPGAVTPVVGRRGSTAAPRRPCLPVLLTSAVAIPGIPVPVLSLVLPYSLGLMGILTPYATGSAPLCYAGGNFGRAEFRALGVLFGGIYLGGAARGL